MKTKNKRLIFVIITMIIFGALKYFLILDIDMLIVAIGALMFLDICMLDNKIDKLDNPEK